MESPGKKRLLLLLIASPDAAPGSAAPRIPSDCTRLHDCELLVVGGQEKAEPSPDARTIFLRNEHHPGYGGSQKLGLRYAVLQGFDFVVMLHSEGGYSFEDLPRLLQPLLDERADAVVGSGGDGGALNWLQGLISGVRLSDFRSGYRAYRVSTLARIPFLLNSNGLGFDAELTIQLGGLGARVLEAPVSTQALAGPTGKHGFRYAWNCLLAALHNRFYQAGLLYRRAYDLHLQENAHYDLKLGFASSHSYAYENIPPGSRVLDLGAGPIGLGEALLRKGCSVTLVDRFPPASPPAGVTVIAQDLDEPLAFGIGGYEVILLLDILEHLRRPEQFLEHLRSLFDEAPRRLILTTPNIAFVVQRLMLLAGQFNYGKAGILDMTHTRLFTFKTLTRLLEESGLRILKVRGVPAPFPKVLGNGRLGSWAIRLNQLLIGLNKSLFSYQIYIEAESTPDIDFILRKATQA